MRTPARPPLDGLKKKLERSRAFARKQNLPPLTHVMLPRTKGFEASLEGLGNLNQAVYVATIAYEVPAPSLPGLFFRVERVHVHTRRFTEWPKTKEEQAAWIIERFREKDELLAGFKKTGAFPA